MRAYLLSLNPAASIADQWDFGTLKDILDELGIEQVVCNSLPIELSGIVVIPARHHEGMEREVAKQLERITYVKLFLMGDEEAVFDVRKVERSGIEIWVQNPRPGVHDNYHRIGTGYPKHMREAMPKELPHKYIDYFFAGQSTYNAPHLNPPMNVNIRRKALMDELEKSETSKGLIHQSQGFTQGLDHETYYASLANAKVAPCPSGPELPDTFRMYEALEMGCLPIADEITRKEDFKDYWTWFYGEEPPFPVIRDYKNVNGWIEDCAKAYPRVNNDAQAWWYRKKWDVKEKLSEEKITVVIPVSPINSHPSTEIIDETIESVKYHLPHAKIIISFDGVRSEQEDMREDYDEHIRAVLWKHRDIYPVIFKDHAHQVGMMRELLAAGHIKTPLLMYVEHDTPLEKAAIDFKAIQDFIFSGKSNHVRFHHESQIPPEHRHMMLKLEQGQFQKTVQYSQRPHVASVAFYKRILEQYFSKDANCFIEDVLHGAAYNEFVVDGELAWNQWRLHIYHPEGNIRRSYHRDGRKGNSKYEREQQF